MTTSKGKSIIESGWRTAGITDAIRLGRKNLPLIDPFHEISPLLEENAVENQQLQAVCAITSEEKQIGYSTWLDDEENEDKKSDDEECDFVLEMSAFDAFEAIYE